MSSNLLLNGNFNLPSLNTPFNSGGISGSPLDYSGANENFLYDIGFFFSPFGI
jgi:hypothetical protein